MGTLSRRKGKDGENEAARLLRGVFPEVKRDLTQYQGRSGLDFTGTPGWLVQVKRLAKRPAVEAMLREAASAPRGGVPVLLIRGDYGEWLAVLYAEDWLAMVEDLQPAEPEVLGVGA
jgi:hypothetical protein